MKRKITEEQIKEYETFLYQEERCPSTIKQYIRSVRKMMEYTKDKEITKNIMIKYKQHCLEEKQYKEQSINAMLTAANGFLKFMGWEDASVKLIKIAKKVFCTENKQLTRKEYNKMVRTAEKNGKGRLAMILQTFAATGIRVSELKYVTTEAVKKGYLEIRNKGKVRKIPISKELKIALDRYRKEQEIQSGMIFVTASGKEVDRSNIWREMKALCAEAGIEEEKVFPHNLRHLFAQCFYEVEKDIAKLADLLGHSRIETTRIYIMSTGVEHRRQMEKMKMVFSHRLRTT